MIKSITASILTVVASFVVVATVNAQAATTPTLEIITPTENVPVPSTTVPILFSVENFEIVDYGENPSPLAGQGHIHLWIDDTNPTTVSAAKVVEDVYIAENVAYGKHTFVAELVTNNHESLTPPKKVTVNFTSEEVATPEATISSGFDKNTALVIFIVVALVIIAAWWYTKDEEDETHEKEEPKKKTTKKKVTKKRKKA